MKKIFIGLVSIGFLLSVKAQETVYPGSQTNSYDCHHQTQPFIKAMAR
ncbi:MAG: hypothetical protein WDO16_05380 [Bacteroidota bacterium]